MEELKEGSEEALGALYHATKSAVYGFALSLLKHRENAEDVMQETYVKLFQNAAQYRSEGKPMAYILRIVRNLAMTRHRKAEPSPLPEEDITADARDYVGQSLDRTVLNYALEKLSEEERQIVILHSITGLLHREIADLLGLPLSTVLSKYRRALSKLSILLKEEEF